MCFHFSRNWRLLTEEVGFGFGSDRGFDFKTTSIGERFQGGFMDNICVLHFMEGSKTNFVTPPPLPPPEIAILLNVNNTIGKTI